VYLRAVMASVKQRLQAPDVDKQSVFRLLVPPPPLYPKKSASAPTVDIEQSLSIM
jgi:hypothetical protein